MTFKSHQNMSVDVGISHIWLMYHINEVNKKQDKVDWQKPSLGIMKNGYWSNYEEWRRKIGDLEALESKVIINFRVFFLKANFRVYYGIVFTYFITYTQTYMRTEEQ